MLLDQLNFIFRLLNQQIGVSYQEMQPSDEVKDTMINCMKEQGMSEGENFFFI